MAGPLCVGCIRVDVQAAQGDTSGRKGRANACPIAAASLQA
jgi:hypothetical protein